MKEKDKIKSKTDQAGRGNPFSVPGNYFESFPQKLMQRIEADETLRVPLSVRVWNVLRPQIALAAAITGFALIAYFGFLTFVHNGQEWLSDDDFDEYMEYYRHDFGDYYLLGILEEYDLFPDDEEYYEDTPGYYDPEAYMDYLYKDNIDIDLILSEF